MSAALRLWETNAGREATADLLGQLDAVEDKTVRMGLMRVVGKMVEEAYEIGQANGRVEVMCDRGTL